MLDELKSFIKKIEQFETLKSSEQIDFFAHFFIFELKQENFTASQKPTVRFIDFTYRVNLSVNVFRRSNLCISQN